MDFRISSKKVFKKFFIFYPIVSLIVGLACIFFNVEISPEEAKILVFLIIGSTSGVLIFFLGWEYLSKKRMIEGIPTSKIRSLPMGIVEVKGKAVPRFPVQTPVNRVNCVFYRYKVEVFVSRGVGSRKKTYWKIVRGGQSITPFFIQDETGRILVEPFECEAFLKRRYYYSEGFFDGARRFCEWYIMPGEDIYVMGYAGKSREILIARKQKLRERLQELKKNPEKWQKYDLNKDGNLDAYEWSLAVEQIKAEIKKEELLSSDKCDVAVSSSRDVKLFISDRSEEELLKNFGWKSFLFIFGGLLLFALSVFYLFQKFANIKM